jgi:pyruvyl transferase EpsI
MSLIEFYKNMAKKTFSPLRRYLAHESLEKKLSQSQNGIILFNIPDHKNIGDHAIAIGEHTFFEHYFPNYRICEITTTEWSYGGSADLANQLPPDMPVFFHGGGFLGSLWQWEENCVCNAITALGKRPYVILPQTLYFSADSQGKSLRESRIDFYSQHPEVNIFLRDKRSYALSRDVFPGNRSFLFPDTTFYMDGHPAQEAHREGAVLCFRNDTEKVVDTSLAKTISYMLKQRRISISRTDTVIANNVKPINRVDAVEEKLNEFRTARLVVTDRLHGLILCAITGTPCLAFNNVSKKVEGAYEWVKQYPFIRLIKPEELTGLVLDELLATPISSFEPRQTLAAKFDEMAQTIQKITGLHSIV